MMSDLIKREDAIKEIKALLIKDESRHLNDLEYGNNQALYHMIDNIEDLPYADRPQGDEFKNFDRESLILLIECQKERIGELLADRPQGWISCSERLPSKGVAVLVNGTMYDAPPITISTDAPYYYEQGWINAWMPLPEPWKGADDE